MQRLPVPLRDGGWRVYALLRRKARRELLAEELPAIVARLVEYVRDEMPLNVVSLAVKLAQAYTHQHLNLLGAARRPQRAHAREAFFLMRRSLRAQLGQRTLAPEPVWRKGLLPPTAWHAVCDGSFKTAVSSAGVVVRNPIGAVCAEVSLAVNAANSVVAELQACIHALSTLLALGARCAVVCVDSAAVLSALRETLPLRYCVLEAEIWLLARQFDALEVRLAPRVDTYAADRLAAQLSHH